MTEVLAALRYVVDQFEAALEPPDAQVIPPLLTVAPVVTQTASSAFAAASADAQSPNRVTALREHYESVYGFSAGLRRGFDKTIWEPWRGVTQGDLEAVVAVGDALGVPAAQVLPRCWPCGCRKESTSTTEPCTGVVSRYRSRPSRRT
jgi:hypothetical protein